MRVPNLQQAQRFLAEAEQLNPGLWVAHSRFVAEAAKAIAASDPDLDPERSNILGLLHDIGRREGRTSMRHIIDGYHFLSSRGYEDAARICLTHSFPLQDTNAVFGEWDCTDEERHFVDDYIERTTYTDYDRLLQLCDGLALPTGLVLLEKRMIDIALRYGTNEYTVEKWRATIGIRDYFEGRLGCSIYRVLPGVIQGTFGDT
jgi:hypothetical protein